MRSAIPIALAVLLVAGSAAAQSSLTTPRHVVPAPTDVATDGPESRVERQGAISFVSGGIGEEGRSAMQQMEPNYNLRLLFARQGTGEYLSAVDVNLADGQGKTVLATTSEGPFFFAEVPPGRYKLSVASEGRSQTRNVDVAASGAVKQSFYWR